MASDTSGLNLEAVMEGKETGESIEKELSLLLSKGHTVEVTYHTQGIDEKPTVLRGRFVWRRPRAGDNVTLATRISRLTAGAPWASIPPDNQEIIAAIASAGLFLESSPDWFKLDGSDNGRLGDDLMVTLYRDYQDYLLRYFREFAESGKGAPKISLVEVPS